MVAIHARACSIRHSRCCNTQTHSTGVVLGTAGATIHKQYRCNTGYSRCYNTQTVQYRCSIRYSRCKKHKQYRCSTGYSRCKNTNSTGVALDTTGAKTQTVQVQH